MDCDNYAPLCEELEKQELDAPNGVPNTHVYEQMLGIYLLHRDLTAAKFLWKRIHSTTKLATPELGLIWNVGQKLWQRDIPGVYEALNVEWSPVVKDIMQSIQENTQKRALKLVSQAYTSISCQDFSRLAGVNIEEAVVLSAEQGWSFDAATNMILPIKTSEPAQPLLPSEEQLRKMTEYVSFLEN